MKKFKYIGPSDEVEVPALGVVVERGHQVEVHDTEAAASLESQGDTWEHIPQPKPKKATSRTRAEKAAQEAAPAPAPGLSGNDEQKEG